MLYNRSNVVRITKSICDKKFLMIFNDVKMFKFRMQTKAGFFKENYFFIFIFLFKQYTYLFRFKFFSFFISNDIANMILYDIYNNQ